MRLVGFLGLLTACLPPPAPVLDPSPPTIVPTPEDGPPLKVGSFNIDWLWDHYEGEYTPRNAADYAMIAQLIVEMDLDVLALQEINGEGALELLDLPPHYAWTVGESGWSQNPAVLYRTDRVSLAVEREVVLPSSEWPSKDPLAVEVTSLDGRTAFTLVNVHFHPFSSAEAAATRFQQAQELHTYLTQTLPLVTEPPFDTHVLVAGDFNDTFEGLNPAFPSLAVFEDDPAFSFATLDTDDYTEIRYRSTIDHLVVSEALAPQYVTGGTPGACHVVPHDLMAPYNTYTDGFNGTPNISSHRPLYLELGPVPRD